MTAHGVAEVAERIATALALPLTLAVHRLAEMLVQARFDGEWEARVREHLAVTGLAAHWNGVLDHGRARYLAGRLRRRLPGQAPRVLDVLSGTGTVAAALRDLGCHVVEGERFAHYPRLAGGPDRFDLDGERGRLAALEVEAVVVVTSLHHEQRLDTLLGWLGCVSAPRTLVVENLRTAETERDLHERFDWFFNRCLNEFNTDCPGWYWDRQQWELLLGSLGRVQWRERMTDVPGIPFSYDLFEIVPGAARIPARRRGRRDRAPAWRTRAMETTA